MQEIRINLGWDARGGLEEIPPAQRMNAKFSGTGMIVAKQVRFCGAVARALLIGVKFGGFCEGLIGRS